MKNGVTTGLATDVSGGSSLSLFRVIQDAIGVSKLRWRLKDDSDSPLTTSEAFFLASKGGGAFFGKVGSFEAGFDADFSVLDESLINTPLDGLSVSERLEMYIYRAADKPVFAKYIIASSSVCRIYNRQDGAAVSEEGDEHHKRCC